jgi:hypothetical protein
VSETLHLRLRAPYFYPDGSSRQGRNPAGGSPVVPIARFRHVAIPRPMMGNQMGVAWRKRPGRPARWIRSGGCNRGVEQVWEPEHKGMTAAPRRAPSLKLHCDDYFWRAELVTSEARPMPFGKKREKHRRGAAGYGSKRLYKDCGDNVGKGHLPAGTGNNLQRPIVKANAGDGGRDLVWRMGSYER